MYSRFGQYTVSAYAQSIRIRLIERTATQTIYRKHLGQEKKSLHIVQL